MCPTETVLFLIVSACERVSGSLIWNEWTLLFSVPTPRHHQPTHPISLEQVLTLPDEIMYSERQKNDFSLVCWVHLIEIKSALSTYGKEQEAIFICNVMLIQENLSVSEFR